METICSNLSRRTTIKQQQMGKCWQLDNGICWNLMEFMASNFGTWLVMF
jgi:hypothetical protein